MRPANRRRAGESMASDRRRPPPTPNNSTDPWKFLSTPVPGRESDASFCSGRPSISSIGRPSGVVPNIADRSFQASALRTINSYLAQQSLPFSLKHPLPTAKEITETLRFLLQRLGFSSDKMTDDLTHVLKFLKCPLNFNKSALRAPGTPHSWPTLLAVIHWLVQMIKYMDFEEDSPAAFEDDKEFMYTVNSYLCYINGDDDGSDALDEECIRELTAWKDKMQEMVNGLEENVKEMELKLEELTRGPSQKEVLEKEKAVLEKDVTKFHVMIEQLDGHFMELQKKMEEKKSILDAKVEEKKRIDKEDEELRKKIEEQGINSRDAERMKRELQALERDIEENEHARNAWEEKIWDLESQIAQKFKELVQLAMEANQAIRRLEALFQYKLNPKAYTASEVLGSDYKTTLKPAFASFSEEIKRSSMGKLDELISLRQQSGENAAMLERKRQHVTSLQSRINELEAEVSASRKQLEDYASMSAAEAKKLTDKLEADIQALSILEKEAVEFLKVSKAELQEIIDQSEKEVMACAQELYMLINTVSTYKEYMGSKIDQLRNDLIETTGAVADIYERNCNP